MKIKDIRIIPLVGATPDGGWDQGFEEEDNLHSLVEVITDEGVVGLGSVYTSAKLVEGALGILRPMLIGESAIEPVRVCENLHQSTFWQGRGGSITHAISGIDIALWDIFGKVTGQPISRLLGRALPRQGKALRLPADDRTGASTPPSRRCRAARF